MDLNLVETTEDCLEVLRWLNERRPEQVLAVDIETTGLSHREDHIRLVQFGDEQAGWAVPWDDWRGLVRDVFERWDGEWVGHNVRFDWKFIEGPNGFDRRIIPETKVHDTMIAASLTEPHKSKALKNLAVRHVWAGADRGQHKLDDAMKQGGWNWATVPVDLPEYWGYAALDTVLTARLHVVLQDRMKQIGTFVAYDLEREAAVSCMRQEQQGVRIDLDYCRQKSSELRAYAAELQAYATEHYGVSSLGSNDECIARLRQDDVPLFKMTRGGSKLCLDEEVLESPVVQQHQLAQVILNYRKASKLCSTYFESFLEKHSNGRLHPSINTVAARTGRMSVDNPALQTLPRGPVVRNAFLPDEGCKWISIDYQGEEARLLAHFSGEERMIQICKEFDAGTGPDLHTKVAQLVYGLGDAKPSKAQRTVAKSSQFAILYGAGIAKFSLTAGIPVESGREFFDTYHRLFPRVKPFQQDVQQAVAERAVDGVGWVRNPRGRIHWVDVDKAYVAVNYVIQGTGGDVLKEAIVNCSRAGLDQYMVLPVHDEICFNVPEEIAAEVTNVAVKNMERHDFRCPLVVEASPPAESWGAAK